MVNGTASIFCLLKSTISSFILLLAGCFLSNKVHLLFVSYFISTRALDHDLLSTSPSSFHWLPGAAHIRFQTLVLAYKASLPGPHTYLKAVLIPPFSMTSRQNDWFNLLQGTTLFLENLLVLYCFPYSTTLISTCEGLLISWFCQSSVLGADKTVNVPNRGWYKLRVGNLSLKVQGGCTSRLFCSGSQLAESTSPGCLNSSVQ